MQRKWLARGVGTVVFLSMYVGLATLSDVTGAYYLGEGIAALFFGAFVADKIDPVDNE